MTFNQDYYGILGIDSHASPQVVVHVYKSLQKAYHPDLHPENRAFYTEKIQIINEAFEILGNPKARAEYDRILAGDFSDSDDASFSDDQQSGCHKCGKRKEDFEIACSNCGSWFTSTMSEKSSFHDNLRTVVQYDTIRTMGFNIAKTAIGATTYGFVTIKENGVRLAKESASMIGEQVSRIVHGRSHSDLWS
jgi:DnaJ-class molecular chaperone